MKFRDSVNDILNRSKKEAEFTVRPKKKKAKRKDDKGFYEHPAGHIVDGLLKQANNDPQVALDMLNDHIESADDGYIEKHPQVQKAKLSLQNAIINKQIKVGREQCKLTQLAHKNNKQNISRASNKHHYRSSNVKGGTLSSIITSALTGGQINPVIAHSIGLDKLTKKGGKLLKNLIFGRKKEKALKTEDSIPSYDKTLSNLETGYAIVLTRGIRGRELTDTHGFAKNTALGLRYVGKNNAALEVTFTLKQNTTPQSVFDTKEEAENILSRFKEIYPKAEGQIFEVFGDSTDNWSIDKEEIYPYDEYFADKEILDNDLNSITGDLVMDDLSYSEASLLNVWQREYLSEDTIGSNEKKNAQLFIRSDSEDSKTGLITTVDMETLNSIGIHPNIKYGSKPIIMRAEDKNGKRLMFVLGNIYKDLSKVAIYPFHWETKDGRTVNVFEKQPKFLTMNEFLEIYHSPLNKHIVNTLENRIKTGAETQYKLQHANEKTIKDAKFWYKLNHEYYNLPIDPDDKSLEAQRKILGYYNAFKKGKLRVQRESKEDESVLIEKKYRPLDIEIYEDDYAYTVRDRLNQILPTIGIDPIWASTSFIWRANNKNVAQKDATPDRACQIVNIQKGKTPEYAIIRCWDPNTGKAKQIGIKIEALKKLLELQKNYSDDDRAWVGVQTVQQQNTLNSQPTGRWRTLSDDIIRKILEKMSETPKFKKDNLLWRFENREYGKVDYIILDAIKEFDKEKYFHAIKSSKEPMGVAYQWFEQTRPGKKIIPFNGRQGLFNKATKGG